ncbi:MAG: hydrogenase 4 subunit F [Coxiellaceae bacterium]|jgi:hydrogenase-4 component F|nr:hydrogenase 4 subunit F [Coxiellaceae bacterium]
MIAFYLLLLLPLVGSLLMLIIGGSKFSGYCNIFITIMTFVSSIFVTMFFLKHGSYTIMGQQFYIDAFNLLMIGLTTFTTMTTAFFPNTYMWNNVVISRINRSQLLLYHFMYQLFTLIALITLSTNNLGILWVSLEGATLATVLLISMYRTKEAIEAAWKYFILCIVGIGLALFGIILVYFSATQALAQNNTRMLWSILVQSAKNLDPAIIKVASIFILVGYGTKIGLAPLHNWLPDAYSESPTPVTVLLSGLLSNVAFYALIRFKLLADHALNNNFVGNLIIGFGVLSFIIGAVLIQRQHNIKRLFAYSSIEHMGLIAIAFGIGGKTAIFIGLFYILIHSIVKSATFMIAGNIVQQGGTQILEKNHGVIVNQPQLGWGLIIATLALAAVPPFSIFTSELMLLVVSMKFSPFLALVLIVGLIIALGGLLRNIPLVVYGENQKNALVKVKTCNLPTFLHLSLALILGIYLPSTFQLLLQVATSLLTK